MWQNTNLCLLTASISPPKRIPKKKNIYGESSGIDERARRARRRADVKSKRKQQFDKEAAIKLKRKQKREKEAAKKQARLKAQKRRRFKRYVSMNEILKMRKELPKGDHEGRVRCPMCIEYKERSKISHHLLVHTKEQPYKCDFCYSRFKRKGSVKNHIDKDQCPFFRQLNDKS